MKVFLFALLMNTSFFLHAINWTDSPPDWMLEQIEEDLIPFSTELSSEALDRFFKEHGNDRFFSLTRMRIQNGELTFDYSDSSHVNWITNVISNGFRKLAERARLPDLDLLFSTCDTIFENPPNIPVFIQSKLGNVPGILFPDWFGLRAYSPEKNDIMEGNTLYPNWNEKIPLLFFRGGDTSRDNYIDFSKWDMAPRVRLVRLSLQRPDLIDARFYFSLHNVDKVEEARQEGMITMDFVHLRDHPRYKYLVDLDGTCASSPRTAAIFHSNSVVFKEVSPSKQWWYKLLVPYVHYIPVATDLSDVFSQIEWAKANDEACQIISKNGRELVLDVLSEDRIYQYIYHLLVAYAQKQKAYY